MRQCTFDAGAMVVIIQNSDPGSWIILQRNIVGPPYQTGCKWTKIAKSTECNKKISKKKSCVSTEKLGSENLEDSLFKATISQRVPVPTPSENHIGKTNFLCIYPGLFWDQIWIRLRIRGRLPVPVVKEFFKKNISKIDGVIEWKIFLRFGL
jgi:hypothetical protein